MPIAVTPNETWDFQLEEDYLVKPERDPKTGVITKRGRTNPEGTWFTLRALPSWVEAQVSDAIEFELTDDGQLVHQNRGTITRMQLQHGVVGIRNFREADGKDVPFKMETMNGREVAQLGFMEYLTISQRVELANAIALRQKVTVAEAD